VVYPGQRQPVPLYDAVVTGIFLSVYYVPSPDHAYDSIQYIMNGVAFGWLLRGIHHWGASLMVIFVFAHMLRTFFYAAYKYPREVTWLTGWYCCWRPSAWVSLLPPAMEPEGLLGDHRRHRNRRHGAVHRILYHQRSARRHGP